MSFAPLIAADGAGSVVRRAMTGQLGVRATEDMLEHGYKELTLPADSNGAHRIERHALHIWPRGGFMLIALPNVDGSFTVTLFLALQGGDDSFAALVDRAAVEALFSRHFPDVVPLMPELARDFLEHPIGRMGTVRIDRWSADGQAVLIGDAAHAIVPFHGQGMNAAFEDCVALDDLLGRHTSARGHDWPAIFAAFEDERAPNAHAIAEMALENYREMRDDVRDPKFQVRADLSFELERRFPGRFIPRYSMVMFHPEIPYADAQRRGVRQAQILHELTDSAESIGNVDLGRAGALIDALL
jgi:kynurenine 3-monooxygenase